MHLLGQRTRGPNIMLDQMALSAFAFVAWRKTKAGGCLESFCGFGNPFGASSWLSTPCPAQRKSRLRMGCSGRFQLACISSQLGFRCCTSVTFGEGEKGVEGRLSRAVWNGRERSLHRRCCSHERFRIFMAGAGSRQIVISDSEPS